MQDSFKAVVKPYNGKVQPCRVCEKTPNEGDELWMQNLGDDINKKWIISPHEECFKKLQENPELGKKQGNNSGGGRFASSKFPIAEAVNLYKLSEEFLDTFMKKREGEEKLTIGEQVVFIESVFRTLSGNFKP